MSATVAVEPRPLTDRDWGLLLRRIGDKECTPFLGPDVCQGCVPSACDIAREWVTQFEYPLVDEADDLARVAQFVAVEEDLHEPRRLIRDRLRAIARPNFHDPDEPHGVLADLKLPVYVTTNFDDFMVQALRDR